MNNNAIDILEKELEELRKHYYTCGKKIVSGDHRNSSMYREFKFKESELEYQIAEMRKKQHDNE